MLTKTILLVAGLAFAPLFANAAGPWDTGDLYSSSRHSEAVTGDRSNEKFFFDQNAAAMKTMMDAMAIKPSGNVDRDFVAMMAPHHQAAVDMALVYLRFGRNEKLKRMAHEIVVTQRQDIVAMHDALGIPCRSGQARNRCR